MPACLATFLPNCMHSFPVHSLHVTRAFHKAEAEYFQHTFKIHLTLSGFSKMTYSAYFVKKAHQTTAISKHFTLTKVDYYYYYYKHFIKSLSSVNSNMKRLFLTVDCALNYLVEKQIVLSSHPWQPPEMRK